VNFPKKKVVNFENLPTPFPASLLISVGLLLDRLGAAGWVWGAFGTVVAVIVIGVLVNRLQTEEQFNPFTGEKK